jgi:hypothetical protein
MVPLAVFFVVESIAAIMFRKGLQKKLGERFRFIRKQRNALFGFWILGFGFWILDFGFWI